MTRSTWSTGLPTDCINFRPESCMFLSLNSIMYDSDSSEFADAGIIFSLLYPSNMHVESGKIYREFKREFH